ncbi:hypothetical protein SNEBB_000029 [Seison nebaliae]|nr:hypothetical protein SNEBB_000029 [Seison nebaliae]
MTQTNKFKGAMQLCRSKGLKIIEDREQLNQILEPTYYGGILYRNQGGKNVGYISNLCFMLTAKDYGVHRIYFNGQHLSYLFDPNIEITVLCEAKKISNKFKLEKLKNYDDVILGEMVEETINGTSNQDCATKCFNYALSICYAFHHESTQCILFVYLYEVDNTYAIQSKIAINLSEERKNHDYYVREDVCHSVIPTS